MSQGWISLNREICDHWLWKDKPFTKGQAWIDILLRVNHKPNKVPIGNNLVDVLEGETVWSIKDMADRWGWSRKKVSNFLNILETELQITQKRTSKYTHITVVKWASYQNKEHEKNINGTSNAHQTHTNNNDNNEIINNIWSAYPRKEGKKKSVESYIPKLLKKYSEEQILLAIKRYDKSVKDKSYLAHGSTFFNTKYLDYIDEGAKQTKGEVTII